jgi:hypothetical protein
MIRTLALLSGAVVAWALLAGCQRQPPAPNPRTMANATVGFCGYTFTFDGEYDGPLNVNGHRNTTRAADGTESALDEDITVNFGSHTARVLNGTLTAEGRDRGGVKQGDTIRLTPAGGVSVNGAER